MSAEVAIERADGRQKRSRNWWKLAFFVALIAFEIAREAAVIEGAAGAKAGSSLMIYNSGGFVIAEGTWARTDGGSPLMPTAITIECRADRGECVEASANIINDHVFSPNLDWFDAKFTPEAVTYTNDIPACATYSVRIDFSLNKVWAVRDRKEGATKPLCANLEERVEMELIDGSKVQDNPLDDHFVPLLSALAALAEASR